MPRRRNLLFILLALPLVGCTWPPPILPDNLIALPAGTRTPAVELDGATIFDESDLADAQWLQLADAAPLDDSDPPDFAGGYLSTNESADGRLVIMIPGASTFETGGVYAQARKTSREQGAFFRDAGYRTLVIARRECDSAYGGAEVDDVRAILDWLDAGGAAALGVERIYVYGYSTGGTVVTVLNRQRSFAAGAALSGLTSPRDLLDRRQFLDWIGELYIDNAGLCQLGSTFSIYGGDAAPDWDALNTLDHIDELKSPELFAQGDKDIIFSPENLRQLRARYDAGRADHPEWVNLEFVEQPDATHFSPPEDPDVHQAILDFFARY